MIKEYNYMARITCYSSEQYLEYIKNFNWYSSEKNYVFIQAFPSNSKLFYELDVYEIF